MEQWREIAPGYKVSDRGNVISTKYKQPRLLKPGMAGKGEHLQVTLRIDGESKKMLVHRLVAMAFIPNPDNLPMVDHINGNPLDNRVENLRWVTNRTNLQNRNDRREGRTLSKYVGVTYQKARCKWLAKIYLNGKCRHLGSFDTEEEAALAYKTTLLNSPIEDQAILINAAKNLI